MIGYQKINGGLSFIYFLCFSEVLDEGKTIKLEKSPKAQKNRNSSEFWV